MSKFTKTRNKNKFLNKDLIIYVVICVLGFSIGGWIVCFFGVGGQMADRFGGDNFLAGGISYSSSFLVSAIITSPWIARWYCPYTEPENREKLEWWKLLGGVLGVISVTSVTAVSGGDYPFLLNAGGNNLMMITMACVVDHFGFLGIPVRKLNRWKCLAVLIFMVGLCIMMVNKDGTFDFKWQFGGSLTAGSCVVYQTAINRRLSRVLPYSIQAVAINYAIGTTLWSVIYAIAFLADPAMRTYDRQAPAWYLVVLSGTMPGVNSFVQYQFSPKIGMIVWSQLFVVGCLSFGFFFDYIQLFTDDGFFEPTWPVITGISVCIIGALVNMFWGQRDPTDEPRCKLSEKSDISIEMEGTPVKGASPVVDGGPAAIAEPDVEAMEGGMPRHVEL